jgi:hypothetical protein
MISFNDVVEVIESITYVISLIAGAIFAIFLCIGMFILVYCFYEAGNQEKVKTNQPQTQIKQEAE